ncbi:efflux RND transporter periplasmic adaptor subunit [Novisyntrophococcus fermenticellae]|uniref:efflux RND transporter periplasmic adaptor subunit n=1 Tax=Novisyntrophococcus fermenticellae TaxID=2068655 RepID=UPI001E483B4C|nr:efflux RND transporter periplasmic adaptor subunit [Novisyntrophococcus fermenticellae]
MNQEEMNMTEPPEELQIDTDGLELPSAAKKKKKLPGWVILPVIGVLALAGVLLSLVLKPAKAPATLTVVSVKKGDVAEEYTTSGTVESESKKTFFSPVNATVQSLNAKVGQAVKEGDLLLSFDTSDLEMNNQQSELNLEAAKAGNQSTVEQADQSASIASKNQAAINEQISGTKEKIKAKQAEVDQLNADVKQEQGNISSAYQDFESQKKQKQEELAALKAECDAAKSKLDKNAAILNNQNAELESKQTKLNNFPSDGSDEKRQELIDDIIKLPDLIAETKNAAIELQAAYDSKLQSYNNALNAYASLSFSDVSGTAVQKLAAAQTELSSLQAALEQLETSAGSPSTAKITDGQYKSMKIQENLAELAKLSAEELVELGKQGIHAEFNGIVSDVQTAEGTAAMQGGALFTLVSNTEVSVRLEVPSNDFDKLKAGSKATIKIGDNTYRGTLTSIDKIATTNLKGNPVIGAEVHIDNPDENIYIGVSSKVTLSVAESKDVLCLSNEVVNTGTDGDFVYVIRDGRVKKQMVELGIASNSVVEIKGGLKEGDEVITDVTSSLEEGMTAIGVADSK